MTTEMTTTFATETRCLRCGYDLRSVADDAPCPECGLLAVRSRRPTDALRDASPRWLRALSIGVWLMLLAVPAAVLAPFVAEAVEDAINSYRYTGMPQSWERTEWLLALVVPLGWHVAAALLLAGAVLVTRPEGHGPADRAGRGRRAAIRALAAVPLLALLVVSFVNSPQQIVGGLRAAPFWVAVVSMLVMAPLPVLGMEHLRSLAVRLSSPHLAEHCRIVGWLVAGTLAGAAAVTVVFEHARDWGLGHNWTSNSMASLAILATVVTAGCLCLLWFAYVLVRFAIFFGRESRALRKAWREADRARPV